MTTEAQKRANQKFKELHPEKMKEYKKRYYEKHKEEIMAKKRAYEEQNKDKIIEIRQKYYEKHKEAIYLKNKEYIKNNRQKITEALLKRRKQIAGELKEKGMIYTYLPKTQREEKTIKSLSKKTGISEEEAKEMLIANDWNYYAIIERFKF